jgi:potassium-transporting ATPase KdpC subunit
MFAQLRAAFSIFVLLTIATGVVYPLLVTVVAQAIFPHQAGGSLIVDGDGAIVGSALIGQPFDDPKYFWSRPSATGPVPYNAAVSSGSNLGPTNPALSEAVVGRVQALQAADPDNKAPVPVDLVTASGSGLDPHISPAAAEYQLSRVARVRGIDPAAVRKLVAEQTAGRTFGVLGEPRVNVLLLNRALDALSK